MRVPIAAGGGNFETQLAAEQAKHADHAIFLDHPNFFGSFAQSAATRAFEAALRVDTRQADGNGCVSVDGFRMATSHLLSGADTANLQHDSDHQISTYETIGRAQGRQGRDP